jgi:hypothetical protein
MNVRRGAIGWEFIDAVMAGNIPARMRYRSCPVVPKRHRRDGRAADLFQAASIAPTQNASAFPCFRQGNFLCANGAEAFVRGAVTPKSIISPKASEATISLPPRRNNLASYSSMKTGLHNIKSSALDRPCRHHNLFLILFCFSERRFGSNEEWRNMISRHRSFASQLSAPMPAC